MFDQLVRWWGKFTGKPYRPDWTRTEYGQAYSWVYARYPYAVVNALYVYRGVDIPQLRTIAERDSLYPTFRYRHFTRPKKDGTLRDLYEPDERLKIVQRHLLRTILKSPRIHPAAVGYRRKKSTADHAWAHSGAQTIITADIEDFFPSTKTKRVEHWWRLHLESYLEGRYGSLEQYDLDDSARLLTLLTTHKGSLPQGAPTSPILSNVVNYEMDAALERRVQLFGGTYTRYCDDLAFSWRLGEPPADFEPAVRMVLAEYGYRVHRWQVWNIRDEPEITGIVLKRGGGVDVPDDVKKTMRKLSRSQNSVDQERLAGYRAYERMVTVHPQTRAKPKPSQPAQTKNRHGHVSYDDDEDDE